MEFELEVAIPALRRTPEVLRGLLADVPESWVQSTEGPGTWSPYDVVGHLIHGERTDWVPRAEHLLRYGDSVPFPVFDREAMFSASEGISLGELLNVFAKLRATNLNQLEALDLSNADLARHGSHPEFGLVSLKQHLATWVAHDLDHIGQVVRVMAKQYDLPPKN